jgi:GNAT superfamily N-acetyltransferase
MSETNLKPARALSLAERVSLFNAGYEGYRLPMHLDEAGLTWMVDTLDFDLNASRVAYRDGAPVGFANLAVRGDEAWVGGVGVITAARRSGVGEALMEAIHEQARDLGVKHVWLEVIVENTGAFALYEKLGYETVRDVAVWSLPLSDSGERAAEDVSAEEAHARIRALRTEREPWQRADESLSHYADARGLATADGAVVYRQSGENVSLIQIAGDAEPVLRTLRTLGAVTVLNLPDDDPAAAVLEALGATVRIRQHEMVLTF